MLSEKKVLRTDCGHQLRLYHTIQSGPVFRWEGPYRFEVSASREGVMVQGHSACMESVEPLVQLLKLAESAHQQLSRGVPPEAVVFPKPPRDPIESLYVDLGEAGA